MMKHLFAVIPLLLATNAWADDPCVALGILEQYNKFTTSYNPSASIGGVGECLAVGYPSGLGVKLSDGEILARVVNNQVSLRADLKTATDRLSAAVDALAKVSAALIENNDKWQKATLNQTIGAINAMPAKLADEKVLQTVLLAAIKEQLLKDSSFLDAVKKAP